MELWLHIFLVFFTLAVFAWIIALILWSFGIVWKRHPRRTTHQKVTAMTPTAFNAWYAETYGDDDE